jgi:hypothetical protein
MESVVDPQHRRERVVGALGAVIVVALAIGAVVGAVTYGAAKLAGPDSADSSPQASAPVRRSPAAHHTDTAPTQPAGSSSPQVPPRSPGARHADRHERAQHRRSGGARQNTHHRRRHRHEAALTLSASPRRVQEMGRVNLFGRYPRHAGARLRVQRLDGGRWGNFPVSVAVRGGRFRTWVVSGRRGTNQFRVRDPATGQVSPAVAVTVG